MSLESIDKVFKEKVTNDIKEVFEQLKAVAYKKLWTLNDLKTTVLEVVEGKEIHIANGKISFDNGKTFVHRSDEKVIKEKFESYEKEIVDFIVNEVISDNKELREMLDRVEKTREGEKSSIDNMFNSFASLSEDEQENVIDHAKIMLEMKVIDEQLDLLKEIGGNKEKVLSLLEQKHSLVKELRNI